MFLSSTSNVNNPIIFFCSSFHLLPHAIFVPRHAAWMGVGSPSHCSLDSRFSLHPLPIPSHSFDLAFIFTVMEFMHISGSDLDGSRPSFGSSAPSFLGLIQKREQTLTQWVITPLHTFTCIYIRHTPFHSIVPLTSTIHHSPASSPNTAIPHHTTFPPYPGSLPGIPGSSPILNQSSPMTHPIGSSDRSGRDGHVLTIPGASPQWSVGVDIPDMHIIHG